MPVVEPGPGDMAALDSDEDDPGEADPKPSESDSPFAFRLPLPSEEGGGGAADAHDSDGVKAAVDACRRFGAEGEMCRFGRATDSEDDRLSASGDGLIRTDPPFLAGKESMDGAADKGTAEDDEDAGDESSSGRRSTGTVEAGGDGARSSWELGDRFGLDEVEEASDSADGRTRRPRFGGGARNSDGGGELTNPVGRSTSMAAKRVDHTLSAYLFKLQSGLLLWCTYVGWSCRWRPLGELAGTRWMSSLALGRASSLMVGRASPS